jgi:hypothetical protein
MGFWVHIPVNGKIGFLGDFSLYSAKIVFLATPFLVPFNPGMLSTIVAFKRVSANFG